MKAKRVLSFALAIMMMMAMLPCHAAWGIGFVTLNVSPQKEAYAVGDTVTVSIPDNGYSQVAIYVVTPDSQYQTVENGAAITLHQAGTWALRGYALTADGEKLYTPENVLLEVKGQSGEGNMVPPTISFSNISNGDTVTAGKDLSVSWTPVDGMDHYAFAARYTDETEQCVAHKNVGLSTNAVVPTVKHGKTLQLWVGAFVHREDQEPVCGVTIQVKTTECDHRSNADDWTFVKSYSRYDKVDSNYHVLKAISVYNIHCSACGAVIQDHEEVTYTYPQEKHYEATSQLHHTEIICTLIDDINHSAEEHKMYYYKCDCGHTWEKTITERTWKEGHNVIDGKCTSKGCSYSERRLSNATIPNPDPKKAFYYSNEFIMFKKDSSVKEGYIRFVSQIPAYTSENKTKDMPAVFDANQWIYGKLNRSAEAAGLCSYATLSMQLSYLGIDCTPGKMFMMLNGKGFNRQTIIDYLVKNEGANITGEKKGLSDHNLTKAELDRMLANYENDPAYSPVFVFMEYGDMWERTHALLIIGQSNGKYFLANPETHTGMGSFEIEVRDGIMYITKASTSKYNNRRIATISQIRKNK